MTRQFKDSAWDGYTRVLKQVERDAQKRRGPYSHRGPSKSKTKIKTDEITDAEIERQAAVREFFVENGELIRLRRGGRTLQEIADECGDSRLGVFRKFQKAPSNKLRLELQVPT